MLNFFVFQEFVVIFRAFSPNFVPVQCHLLRIEVSIALFSSVGSKSKVSAEVPQLFKNISCDFDMVHTGFNSVLALNLNCAVEYCKIKEKLISTWQISVSSTNICPRRSRDIFHFVPSNERRKTPSGEKEDKLSGEILFLIACLGRYGWQGLR